MNNKKVGLVIVLAIAAAAYTTTTNSFQITHAVVGRFVAQFKAPIAVSGDNNVYIAWWRNKTGNDEVMFKASTDGGKTFANKMNLSNTPKSDSQDAQIAAAGSNVYVTWWERNQTMNEPVMRISNDNGKTFGETIMLSEK